MSKHPELIAAHVERLPSGIQTTIPPHGRAADYDRIALGYDLLVGNPLYNRIVWDCPVSAYRAASERFFEALGSGPALDFGCGSLVFTAETYHGREDQLTLFDRSLAMLERGQDRLPEGRFVQGDAFDPPFGEKSFAGAMSWGMLHLFGTRSAYLAQLKRLVHPDGRVALGTLALAGRTVGDTWLHALHRRGEAAAPETIDRVIERFERYFTIEASEAHGNMLILHGRHPWPDR